MKHKRPAPNAALQARLRKMIDAANLHQVSQKLQLTRGQLLQYLTGLPMNPAVLRGIETTLSEVDGGLRR